MTTPLTDNEKETLLAYESILDRTDESDWHTVHSSVRERIADGRLSKSFEQEYKNRVDIKAHERESEE